MEGFKVTVKEIEPIDKDFKEITIQIESKIPDALAYVSSEMLDDLQLHLQNDWYNAYKPQVYERRTDDSSLGTSIMDESNVHISVTGRKLEFIYSPTGIHSNPYWSQRNGDSLIEFIQNGIWDKEHPTVRRYNEVVPARPFWNNFVEEQFNYKIMQNFTARMKPSFEIISEGQEQDIQADSMESLLDAGTMG